MATWTTASLLDPLRQRLERLRHLAEGGALAARALSRSGVLAAMRPAGVAAVLRQARGGKVGPHTALLLHATNKPDKEALIGDGRRLTYGDLAREVNQLAHALVELGVRPGDRVAILLPNCVEFVVAALALPLIGGTAVQIGTRLKAAEVAYLLDHSKPKAWLHHASFADLVGASCAQAKVSPARLVVGGTAADTGYLALVGRQPGDAPPARTGGDAGGVIVYTSGTTGKPKGAKRSWGQTGYEALGDLISQVGLHHDDRHLVVSPMYHSAAPAFTMIMLALGATIVMMDHFDAEPVLEVIARERITCAFMVPTMLSRLAAVDEAVRAQYDTSSLRWILSGAAPLPTETARRVQEVFGPVLWNFYGATETGLVTLAGPADHTARPGTVGRALRGNELRILGEDGHEVPLGEVGELYARNSMLISGYHADDASTSNAMRDGYFSVGDLARMDADGFVYLASRKHDMVISGGVNIYPAEIEDRLHEHPAVFEAAVIGVPDVDWGEALKAFVVLRPGQHASAEELIAFCRETLADYKRPRSVEFLPALPRNPTGKVLKRELRAS